jgi:hypothetical protein
MSTSVRATRSQTRIYFVQPEGGGPIKIGRAEDPEARLKALQTGSPVRLKLCRFVDAPVEWEARLHDVFAEWRSHGEWFRAHPALARLGDCIPDPEIEDSPVDLVGVPTPPAVVWRINNEEYHRRTADVDPEVEYEKALEWSRENSMSNGSLLTALPDDMAREWEWSQSSDLAA